MIFADKKGFCPATANNIGRMVVFSEEKGNIHEYTRRFGTVGKRIP